MRELTEKRRILLKCAAVLSDVPDIPRSRSGSGSHATTAPAGGPYPASRARAWAFASARPSPREVTRFFRADTRRASRSALEPGGGPHGRIGRGDGALAGLPVLRRRAVAHLRFRLYTQCAVPCPISGDELIREFGLKPSALFKHILDSIEEERLSRSELGRAEALEMVRAYLKNQG